MTAPASPEDTLRQMQDTLRQFKTTGHAEVSAASTATIIPAAADDLWKDDPVVYVDVFVRNGGLRVDVGANVASSGGWLSYGWRLYTVQHNVNLPGGGTGDLETLYREAQTGEAVEANGLAGVGCSRASRINGLPPGSYRVRGAYKLRAGSGSFWSRSIIVIPR